MISTLFITFIIHFCEHLFFSKEAVLNLNMFKYTKGNDRILFFYFYSAPHAFTI